LFFIGSPDYKEKRRLTFWGYEGARKPDAKQEKMHTSKISSAFVFMMIVYTKKGSWWTFKRPENIEK
jgi:hypothetical protein